MRARVHLGCSSPSRITCDTITTVATVPTINPRINVGLGQPKSSNGSLRPLLSPNLMIMTGHYTGVNKIYKGTDTAAEIRKIQVTAIIALKPFEYNWVVDQDGVIWEYAGDYRAAHSEGENSTAIGVLILVGIGEVLTDAAVVAFQYLRANLIHRGRLSVNCETLQHRQMPGAATACPGDQVIARWDDLLKPFEIIIPPDPPPDPPVDPPVTPTQEADVEYLRVYRNTTQYVDFRRAGNTLVWLTRAAREAEIKTFVDEGLDPPPIIVSQANVTDLLKGYVLLGPLPNFQTDPTKPPDYWPQASAFATVIT